MNIAFHLVASGAALGTTHQRIQIPFFLRGRADEFISIPKGICFQINDHLSPLEDSDRKEKHSLQKVTVFFLLLSHTLKGCCCFLVQTV